MATSIKDAWIRQLEHEINTHLDPNATKAVKTILGSLARRFSGVKNMKEADAQVKRILGGELTLHARTRGIRAAAGTTTQTFLIPFPLADTRGRRYINAVIEYIADEIIELSANHAIMHNRRLVTVPDVRGGIAADIELTDMLKRLRAKKRPTQVKKKAKKRKPVLKRKVVKVKRKPVAKRKPVKKKVKRKAAKRKMKKKRK